MSENVDFHCQVQSFGSSVSQFYSKQEEFVPRRDDILVEFIVVGWCAHKNS